MKGLRLNPKIFNLFYPERDKNELILAFIVLMIIFSSLIFYIWNKYDNENNIMGDPHKFIMNEFEAIDKINEDTTLNKWNNLMEKKVDIKLTVGNFFTRQISNLGPRNNNKSDTVYYSDFLKNDFKYIGSNNSFFNNNPYMDNGLIYRFFKGKGDINDNIIFFSDSLWSKRLNNRANTLFGSVNNVRNFEKELNDGNIIKFTKTDSGKQIEFSLTNINSDKSKLNTVIHLNEPIISLSGQIKNNNLFLSLLSKNNIYILEYKKIDEVPFRAATETVFKHNFTNDEVEGDENFIEIDFIDTDYKMGSQTRNYLVSLYHIDETEKSYFILNKEKKSVDEFLENVVNMEYSGFLNNSFLITDNYSIVYAFDTKNDTIVTSEMSLNPDSKNAIFKYDQKRLLILEQDNKKNYFYSTLVFNDSNKLVTNLSKIPLNIQFNKNITNDIYFHNQSEKVFLSYFINNSQQNYQFINIGDSIKLIKKGKRYYNFDNFNFKADFKINKSYVIVIIFAFILVCFSILWILVGYLYVKDASFEAKKISKELKLCLKIENGTTQCVLLNSISHQENILESKKRLSNFLLFLAISMSAIGIYVSYTEFSKVFHYNKHINETELIYIVKYYLSPALILITIELLAAFIFRQYRNSINDYKYYHNVLLKKINDLLIISLDPKDFPEKTGGYILNLQNEINLKDSISTNFPEDDFIKTLLSNFLKNK